MLDALMRRGDERDCVEVIGCPKKSGGRYKAQERESDSNNVNICALEVMSERVRELRYDWPSGSCFMYHRQQLESSVYPSAPRSSEISALPAIHQNIDKNSQLSSFYFSLDDSWTGMFSSSEALSGSCHAFLDSLEFIFPRSSFAFSIHSHVKHYTDVPTGLCSFVK